MKKIHYFILCILTFWSASTAQTLYVANSNPGATSGTNVFTGSTAITDALAVASNGDIIYVVPSQVSYGTVTIAKEITLFGIGLRPSKDIAVSSYLKEIFIDASNVRLSGLIVDQDVNVGLNLSSTTVSNITIENCRIGRVEMGSSNNVTVSNMLVRNNVIEGYGTVATSILLYTISNVTITNNIIFTSCCTAPSLRVTGATITYNVFMSDGNRGVDANLVANNFDHNIFYGVNVNLQSGVSINNVWTDNLSFGGTQLTFVDDGTDGNTGSGNMKNVDPLFSDPPPISRDWNNSYDFTLSASSPALNINGEDIGPSGGLTPFDPEGNLLPLIQTVTIPSTIAVGSDLPVTIKAKGN